MIFIFQCYYSLDKIIPQIFLVANRAVARLQLHVCAKAGDPLGTDPHLALVNVPCSEP